MELIYSALLLHAAKQKIDEANVTKVLQAAGITPDATKVKALVAALENINIDEAISKAVAMPTTPTEAKVEKKEEKKEEDMEKKAEQAVEGLAGLFG
ncbi:MAG: 50S ribosomal protein L12 [Candidatus Aenigmatarchaeota archaeon]